MLISPYNDGIDIAMEVTAYTKSYVAMNRIPEDEVPQVYADFEVAGHGFRHEFLADLNKETMSESIDKDIDKLSIIFQRDILGFAYPFGSISDTVVSKLKTKGILYARTVTSSKGFKLPKDPLRWNPTCPMIDKNLFSYAKKFIRTQPINSDLCFYVWGHGYEFDYGTENSNWDRLKRLCALMAEQSDIISCTNQDVIARMSS